VCALPSGDRLFAAATGFDPRRCSGPFKATSIAADTSTSAASTGATRRDSDGGDIGRHVAEDWLRVGDEFDHAGGRWKVVDRLLRAEADRDYADALLHVEPG